MIQQKAQKPVLFTLLSALIIAFVILTIILLRQYSRIEYHERIRNNSILIAAWLKQSSDDLTRYCRTYVVTKDSIWEDKYWEIIDIRNGEKPWPNGSIISLRDSLTKLNFSQHEFELLTEAENNSNALILTEKIAFNAMKGLFSDSSNQFNIKAEPDTLLAKQILFDKKYHKDKESIMKPISDFTAQIDQRTQSAVTAQENTLELLFVVIAVLLILIICLSFYVIVILQRRINVEIVETNKAKQKMELAMDAANVGIWDWDFKKDELIWDEALYQLYGIASDTFSGAYEAWINGVHPEDAQQADTTIKAAIKEDKLFDSEFRVIWPDKTIRYVRGLGKLLKNESGEPDRMIGVNWDITDSKLNEEELKKAKEIAEDATEAKSAFLASMSHEIRTPMNAVIGLSHLALQTKLDPKQHDYLYKIRSSGKALLGIINDILDFSKIEAGKLSIEITNFDLERVFGDVATVITYKAHEKGLEVVFNISPDIPLLLVGDSLRIGQILINLANNAVKFTNEGEIVIQVEIEENPPSIDENNSLNLKDNIWLRFSVKDTGIGIKKDQINYLFESFTQSDRSTSRKFGGTGLGLAISKNLVEMMHGNIWVESEIDEGSTFSFNVNLEPQIEQKQKVFIPTKDLQKMKVLVCDDNLTSLEVLTSMLESFSFKVKAVTSGAEALTELEKEIGKPYELVLLDWKMPELDGLEVAEKIKLNKKLVKIPTIIMVTAYTRDQIIHKVDELQLAGLLSKPVSHSTMFDTIMEAFGKGVTLRPSDQIIDTKHEEMLIQRKGARILLVEDNEINQQVAAELIESAGFIVEIANNGLEAINRMQKRADFDLVFMDIQMPVMDGITASEKLRNDSKFDNIPIVAMTADVLAEIKERCLNIGMNDFITKPISPESVFEAIIKWTKPGERDLSNLKIETAKPLTEQIVIPDLDRINVNEGLIRVNRNRKLYQNLLFKFYNNNVNLINQIKKAYDTGNEETALRLVHTVKGVSGNIAADELHQNTVELERKLKEKDYTDLNEIIDDYAQSLNPVLHAIAEYRNSRHSVNQEAKKEDNEAELNKELFAKLCNSLTALLEDNDPEAIAIVQEVLRLPGLLGENRKQFDEIDNLVKNYNFDGAMDLLKRVNE